MTWIVLIIAFMNHEGELERSITHFDNRADCEVAERRFLLKDAKKLDYPKSARALCVNTMIKIGTTS